MKSAGGLKELIKKRSHPARGAGIEIESLSDTFLRLPSHPARGAWIEITSRYCKNTLYIVAPRKGCVD